MTRSRCGETCSCSSKARPIIRGFVVPLPPTYGRERDRVVAKANTSWSMAGEETTTLWLERGRRDWSVWEKWKAAAMAAGGGVGGGGGVGYRR